MANENIVGQVEDLLQRYQAALAKATGLIELKDQLIELLEEEVKLRKRQNVILFSILMAFCAVITIVTLLYCIL